MIRRNRFFAPQHWFFAAMLVGVLWRLMDALLNFPIWGDEACICLNLVARNYQQLLAPLDYQQVAPVLYLFIEKWILVHWGPSDFALRLPALVAGLAAIPMVYILAKKVGGIRVAWLATALAALSLNPVHYTSMIKPYSIDLLIAALLLWLAFRLIKNPKSAATAAIFLPLTPLVLLLSYPSVFILASVAVVAGLIVIRRGSLATRLILLAVFILSSATFLSMYLHVGQGQFEITRQGMERYWRREFPPLDFSLPLWLLKAHFNAMFSYPAGGRYGLSLVIFPLCIVGAIRLWKRSAPLALLLTLPFLFTFMAAVLHRYPYGGQIRIQQHLAASIFVLSSIGGLALAKFFLKKIKRPRPLLDPLITAIIGFCILCAAVSIVNDYRRPSFSVGYLDLDTLTRKIFTPSLPENTRVIVTQNYYGEPIQTLTWCFLMQPHLDAPRGVVTIVQAPHLPTLTPAPFVGESLWLISVHGEETPSLPGDLAAQNLLYTNLEPPQMHQLGVGPEETPFPWVEVMHIQIISSGSRPATSPATRAAH